MIFEEQINVLLIEDEAYDIQRVQKTLFPFRDRIVIKKNVREGQEALNTLTAEPDGFDVVIMDYQIVGGISGERLIRRIKQIDPTIQIIVITKMTINVTDFDFAARLLSAGAMWYCTKYPGDIEDFIYQPTDFILSIYNAYNKRMLEKDQQSKTKKLKQSIEEILRRNMIIGESEVISNLRKNIKIIADKETTVLITGASGTGKELVATNIHYHSRRKFEKFVTINCGGLPHELIESELFGFEKGAFTGANTGKIGLFEVANRGTIFLDEIGELPLPAQVKLLRVLQEGEIDKIGRTEKIRVDVRIIAATNRNLADAVKEKKFREDLFYRLNVVNLQMPELREHKADIPLLMRHFTEKFSRQMGISIPEIEPAAIDFLINYEWRGNVRQMQNLVQRLLLFQQQKISLDAVRQALGLKSTANSTQPTIPEELWDPRHILPWREMEKDLKRRYFSFVRQNTTSDAKAAKKLGLAPPNYYRMCKELGLK